jgi:riboflavin synthase
MGTSRSSRRSSLFSGMIVTVGEVRVLRPHAGGARIEVGCSLPGEPIGAGESIAVAGTCLSAKPVAAGFEADVSPETLKRTTLGHLRSGSRVNLERAARLGDRLGGHLVTGHVDATTRVVTVERQSEFRTLRIALPGALAPEVATKGSIAVDGVSLTVAALGEGWLEVALVPATLAQTTLAVLRPGHEVNLETDILAKYVRRAVGGASAGIEQLLGEWGDEEG